MPYKVRLSGGPGPPPSLGLEGQGWLWTGKDLAAQLVKNPPAVQETRVPSLGREDLLKSMVNTPVFLPGESPGQRSLGGYKGGT